MGVLFITAAWGQTAAGQNTTQVFHFTYDPTTRGLQELTNAIRTVGEITQASVSFEAKTLTVGGTPVQIAMAAWMFTTMDQPEPANHATQEYRPAGSANDLLRVLYLTQGEGPQGFQEIVNAVRTIPEMTKVFPYTPQNAIVMRGTDGQIAMAEWLFHQLDLPAGMQPAGTGTHDYRAPGATGDLVRVLQLTNAQSTTSFQEIVNAIRTIPELTKVFPSTSTGTVAVRGTPAKIELATWLFSQLDQASAPASQGMQEFRMPESGDDVTRVFYLTPNVTLRNFQDIIATLRTTSNIHRVFSDGSLRAVIVRGTATQMAAADLLIKQMDKP